MSENQTVTITIRRSDAERIQGGLADAACWMNGYMSALQNGDCNHWPMGLEAIRDINLKLKDALGDEA